MRGRDQTFLTDLIRPEDQAIEAVVSRYQRVAPAVTRFARSLSNNPNLRVRLGSEASASADEVVCDPRIFQAAYHRNAPVTPDEVAIASALHEVMHLVSTNFDEPRDQPEGWPIEGEPIPEGKVDLLTALERTNRPVAEVLFFSLEDARQERQGLSIYPGARSVLADLYLSSLAQAIERSGALSQFVLGCFLLTGGYVERDVLEKRFEAHAAVALDDATGHCESAAQSNDPWEVAQLALELEAIARAHGLISEAQANTTHAKRQMEAEAEAEKARDGVDAVRMTSPIVADAESYQDTRRSADARSAASDRKGPSDIADDESTDQLLRVSQAPDVFLPTGQGGKLLVTPIPASFAHFSNGRDGDPSPGFAALGSGAAPRVGRAVPALRGQSATGAALGVRPGRRLPACRTLHRCRPLSAALRASGGPDPPHLRGVPARRRLGLDAEPRREAHTRSSWAMPAALLGAWTMAQLCDELQIDFEVALFNRGFAARPDDTEDSYRRQERSSATGRAPADPRDRRRPA